MKNQVKMTEEQALELCRENDDVCLVQKSGCEKECDQPDKCLYRTLKQKGYIIKEKIKEPLIVHNVMSYKGRNYLRQVNLNTDDCMLCDLNNLILTENFICPQVCRKARYKLIWKSFDDIQITDDLACMRKDIGDIYLKGSIPNLLILSQIIDKDNVIIYVPDAPLAFKVQKTYLHEDLRLATAEELKEYFKREKE